MDGHSLLASLACVTSSLFFSSSASFLSSFFFSFFSGSLSCSQCSEQTEQLLDLQNVTGTGIGANLQPGWLLCP